MFRGAITMNTECPVCGHHFTREQGFFQGAMYISYGLGVVLFFALVLLSNLLLGARFGRVTAMVSAVAGYLLCVPIVFRYSRVIWAHLNIGTRQA